MSVEDAIQEAEAFLAEQQAPKDVRQLSDEELIRHLPDEVLLQRIRGTQQPASPPSSRFGFFGSVPEEAYQRGERNIAGNILERPAAATRGFLQGLAPGGPTPIEGYQRGAINPAQVPSFQQLALDAYYQGHPLMGALSAAPSGPGKTAFGNVVSGVGLGADMLTSPADLLLGAVSSLRPVRQGTQALAQTRPGQAVGRFLTKERHLRFGRRPLETVEEVLRTPEARLPALTKAERQAYFEGRRQQLRQQTSAQSSLLRKEQTSLEQELGKSAQQRSLVIREKLPELYARQSSHYRSLVDRELAPVANDPVSDFELADFLKQRFARDPERLTEVSEKLGLSNTVFDVPKGGQYQGTNPMLMGRSRKIGQLYQESLNLGQTLPRSVREGLRIYSPADGVTDDAIATLVDFLETKDVHLTEARKFWRGWAPIRNQATKEFRPFLASETQTGAGSRRLIRLAKGIDPDNEVYARTVAELLDIDSLPGDLKQIVGKLDSNQKSQLALTLQTQETNGALQALKFRTNQMADRSLRKWEKIKAVATWVAAIGGVGYAASSIRGALQPLQE